MISPVVVPEWNALPWLLHGFSTRAGGRTTAYRQQGAGELNLSFTAEDDRANVLANRQFFFEHLLQGRPQPTQTGIVIMRQTHSSIIHRVKHGHLAGDAPLEGDGLMTDVPGVMLGILTADCVPVLVVDVKRRAVAAFHAGWRGTLAQIVGTGIGRMRQEFGSDPADLRAAVGPAIGQCCYEVGDDLHEKFAGTFNYADSLFSFATGNSGGTREDRPARQDHGPRYRLDLAEANRRQLVEAGIATAQIAMTQLCTSCNVDQFFSYRRENGLTGRMLSLIGRMD